ncbi:MAG TPA: glycosyltransferase family 2 protein [Solirubrobacteraceae bacterium]|jgi:GT2 family glycosyltransferase|nr:glycosyltransferase family 2 protein [Solirubrobacteraceae bacterium]
MAEPPLSDVRIVVLTHGSGAPAAALAGRVLAEGIEPSQLTVVHNPTAPGAPAPGMPDPAIEVLQTPRNLGYTGGMNLGIRRQLERDPGWVLLLTHDVRFEPGALAALAAAAAAHPQYGVLGPELYDPARDTMFSYGARMSATGGMSHLTSPPADERDGIVPADSIDGAFMLIRADALRGVGPFDEKLFIYAEESELCLRVRRAGWKVGVVRAARGEQSVGAPSRPGAYGYLMTRNGLNLARQAVGWRGVAGGLGRALVQVAVHGRRVVDPRRSPEGRAAARAAVEGVVRGAVDFFRGRWGPPPDTLSGLGDTQGT